MGNPAKEKPRESGNFLFALVVLVIYNIFFLIVGLGCIGVGIWMTADPYVRHVFIVLKRNPNDNIMLASASIFIIAGLIMTIIAIVGFIALIGKKRRLLSVYAVVITLVFILQVVIGFIALAYREQIHMYLKEGMHNQLQEHYQWENEVGVSWNFIQVRYKCCGVDGSWDYGNSRWWHSKNPGVETADEAQVWVPKSCCVLEWDQDRDPHRFDPQECRPKSYTRCNEDAAGRKDGSDYLHGRGCFAASMWYIQNSSTIIIGIALGVAALQILGILATAAVIIKTRRIEEWQ